MFKKRLILKYYSKTCKRLEYKTEDAAGIDLPSAEEIILNPGEIASINTGVIMEIPKGYEGIVRGRSGLAFKHHIFCPHVGTIDSDYRGEIRVMLENKGDKPFVIVKGDRIAQIIISPVVQPKLEWVVDKNNISETDRGDKGFGSTGLK